MGTGGYAVPHLKLRGGGALSSCIWLFHNVETVQHAQTLTTIITYASPAWFTLLTQTQKDRIAKLEKNVLKVIKPMEESYADRLASLELLPLDLVIERLSQDHMRKIKSPTHCLHHLLPPTNGASGIIDVHNTRARTQLRKNTFLMNFCNKYSSTFSIKLTHVLFFFVRSLKRGSHKFLKTFVFLPIGKYKDYINFKSIDHQIKN